MNNQIKNFIEEGEKERTDSELAIFWNEIATYLPKSYERNALGDEKIFIAFKQAYPQLKKHIQISLIKMIVEIVENTDEYVEAYDADGNRYQVPKSKKAEWEEWDEYSSSLEEAEETPEWAERIDGLDVISFKDTISSKLTSLIKE